MMNNHSILSMFLTTKGHPYTRAEKRSTFFCQNCIALSFSVFIDALQLDDNASLYMNIFVVSPVMVLVTLQLYYLLACPCLRSCNERGGCAACFASCVESIGWLLLAPICCGCLAFLFSAAIVNRGAVLSAGYRIASYAYSVHVVSATQEAVLSMMHFLTGRYHVKLYVCCIPVMSFGKYYQQKVICGLVEGADYLKIPKKSYFCGLIGLEWIIEKNLWEQSGRSFCCFSTKTAPANSVEEKHQRTLELVAGESALNA